MKEPLKGLFIAASGYFGHGRTQDDFRRWTEKSGGTWMTGVTAQTTHLIATKDHWRKQAGLVKDALALQTVHIVNFDWLEDSLTKKSPRKPESYLWANSSSSGSAASKPKKPRRKQQRQKKQQQQQKALKREEKKRVKRDARKFEEGCQSALHDIDSGTSTSSPSTPPCKTEAENGDSSGGGGGGYGADVSSPSTGGGGSMLSTPDKPVDTTGDGEAGASSSEDSAGSAPRKPETAIETLAMLRAQRKARDAAKAAAASKDAAVEEKGENGGGGGGAGPAKHRENQKRKRTSTSSTNTNPPGLDLHHIHTDSTGFAYRIALTRVCVATNTSERHMLSLYESHTTPHTYALHTRFVARSGRETSALPAPVGASFAAAFKAFREAFERLTRLKWEERLLGPEVLRERMERKERLERIAEEARECVATMEASGAGAGAGEGGGARKRAAEPDSDSDEQDNPTKKKARQANKKDKDEGAGKTAAVKLADRPFLYTPPAEGRPRGLLPPSLLLEPAEEEDDDDDDAVEGLGEPAFPAFPALDMAE